MLNQAGRPDLAQRWIRWIMDHKYGTGPAGLAGNDDCACIREVVWRRYKLAGMFEEVFPDIILIDGGKGQLAAANSAFDELETRPPVLAALAKKQEELFVLGREDVIRLPRRDPALRLLQSVRDEAHRFAQHYHHILRRRKTFDQDVAAGRRPPRSAGPSKRSDAE